MIDVIAGREGNKQQVVATHLFLLVMNYEDKFTQYFVYVSAATFVFFMTDLVHFIPNYGLFHWPSLNSKRFSAIIWP